MKFTEEDYAYLYGEKFSSGYSLPLVGNPLCGRTEVLLAITKGLRCIHIGCCDHVPLIKEKIKTRRWLHGLLEENCKEVLGIDINQDAVDYVNGEQLSREQVYCADVTAEDFISKIPKKEYDFVLLGEIVEHVDNPVLFLNLLKKNMDNYGFRGKYIITVPNAFCFMRNPIYAMERECINTDHRYWFTPYTIAKVMAQAGIKPEELFFVNGVNNPEVISYMGDQIIISGE